MQSARVTAKHIKFIKDNFEHNLATVLSLERISAPLIVDGDSGLNDNLSGSERAVSFDLKNIPNVNCEIVQSLAKWKRRALRDYGFGCGEGLYTDMNAIRRDDNSDEIHSIYVDQWDWEKVITKGQRTLDYLYATVEKIVSALCLTNAQLKNKYGICCNLTEKPFFVTSEQLLVLYPRLTAKEREREITKKYGTVFISQIGGKLSNGDKHDDRAPDYDDWTLNGDILCWHEGLEMALEISSMGIRVGAEQLLEQLEISNCLDRLNLPFHKELAEGKMPYTIGGGIGQSRICMLLLNMLHIGQVQASVWSEEERVRCRREGIELL